MRNAVRLLVALVAVVLAAVLSTGPSSADPPPEVEPIIWQLNRDYPEGSPADADLSISTVYIKTHDGSDWMSTYDQHPLAVSGPQSIQTLINIYGEQGIDVAAWFVPKGTDYETQVAMALQVIDAGVTALYADLEPFAGFCYKDCAALATNFWSRVRQERPSARLGVIYDPRPWWWEQSATSLWFGNADVALPMCYWETYAGQGAFGDPAGCVTQAKADLAKLSPGRSLEYLPILQGDSTPERVELALDAAIRSGALKASLWRRGVVSNDVWHMIEDYEAPSGPHCAENLVEGCVIRDPLAGTVYLMRGGARFGFASWDDFVAMGYVARDVQVMPEGVVATVPIVPGEGTLFKEFGGDEIYIVAAGARFVYEAAAQETSGAEPLIVPPGGAGQVPLVPVEFTRVKEQSGPDSYFILHGGRIQMDAASEAALDALGTDSTLYIVPENGFEQMPILQVKRGDIDCDGTVGALDITGLLRVNFESPAGLCTSVAGNVDCIGGVNAADALLVLLYFAEIPAEPTVGCLAIGEATPALLPGAVP